MSITYVLRRTAHGIVRHPLGYAQPIADTDHGQVGPDAWPTLTAGHRWESAEPISRSELADRGWFAAEHTPTWRQRADAMAIAVDQTTDHMTARQCEHVADQMLAAAGWDHRSEDVPEEIVSPVTMASYWHLTTRPDKVAWRGKARARIVTHRRQVIRKRHCTVALTGHRAWADVTVTDPTQTIAYDHALVTTLIGVADADLVTAPWRTVSEPIEQTRHARAVRRARRAMRRPQTTDSSSPNTRSLSPDKLSVLSVQTAGMGQDMPGTPSDAPTAVYGRLVTAWSASDRSLPRIIARHGVEPIIADLEAILRTSAPERDVPLSGATVRTDGVTCDDGTHGAMPVRAWARRAALAGVRP